VDKQHFESIKIKKNDLEWLYIPDLEYCERDGVKRFLQMIVPYKRIWDVERRFPVVIFIPGSAWHKQEMYNGIINHSHLAQRGFAVIDVQYRECELGVFPAQVIDVKTAIRFVHSIADKFHLDTSNIFVAGDSSGAHVALMTALTADYGEFDPDFGCEPSCSVNGVISMFAPTDMLLSDGAGPVEDMLGVKSVFDDPRIAAAASCYTYISRDREIPPVLMFHGTEDPVVPIKHARELFGHLKRNDKTVEYYEVEEEVHGGAAWWDNDVLDIVERFILKYCR